MNKSVEQTCRKATDKLIGLEKYEPRMKIRTTLTSSDEKDICSSIITRGLNLHIELDLIPSHSISDPGWKQLGKGCSSEYPSNPDESISRTRKNANQQLSGANGDIPDSGGTGTDPGEESKSPAFGIRNTLRGISGHY